MKKILIVEDHSDLREMLRQQIQMVGFAAIAARNGAEGLETAIREKPDLIMVDLMMPEIDGLQMTRILRTNSETKEIPVIAVTAMSRPSDLQSCLEAGCNDYIVKPFRLEELCTKINFLI